AAFVAKVSGADILDGQVSGGPLAVADLAATTDTDASIQFAATSGEAAAYEMYFVAPAAVAGPFTITITAQLGAGAVASEWKVDMYSFLPDDSDGYELVGDLTGVTSGSWSTITLTLNPATPANFVEPTAIEYLVQLRTENAGAQAIYVDQIVVSDGVQGPSPTPVTPQPVVGPTAPPVTAPPVTGPTAPPTVAPSVAPTVAPTAAATPGPVQVDMVPCILASEAVEKDVGPVASAYLFNEFFKGFWTATQNVQAPPAAVLDLVEALDADHGKCSVVYVGIVPSAAQKLQLQDYSRKFNVRIVYFDIADTILDTEVQARLGMQSNFDQPFVGAPRVKRTGGSTDSIAPADMLTDPTQNNLFNRPVVTTVDTLPAGVSILAQYADDNGDAIGGVLAGVTNPQSAAIVEYIGADGLEEMHVFVSLAWFDTGSWAWGHFISEWGSRGIFQARDMPCDNYT
ncbi:unnamed protein product, partial [Ectocarpus sp. 8 AP-2014]